MSTTLVEIPPNIDKNDIEYIHIHFKDPSKFNSIILLENSVILTLYLKSGRRKVENGSSTLNNVVPMKNSLLNIKSVDQTTQRCESMNNSVSKVQITSPMSGILKSINLIECDADTTQVQTLKQNKKTIQKKNYKLKDEYASWLLEIVPCSHPTIFAGACVLCGETVRVKPAQLNNFRKIDHSNQSLMVEEEAAREIGFKERDRLLSQKKLSLILDLDHTLLHAVDNQNLGIFLKHFAHFNGKECKEILPLYIEKMDSYPHYVKLRPHLKKFLKEASEIFELHVVTHGTKLYANSIAKIIDPTKEFFGDRIIGREDCEVEVVRTGAKIFSEMNWETGEYERSQGTSRKWIKKVSHLFPQGVHTVLIIDDTLNVWREDYNNVIQIKPYHFFVASRDINNIPGTAVASVVDYNNFVSPEAFYNFMIKSLEKDEDNELMEMLSLLRRIHKNYFIKLDHLKEEVNRKDTILGPSDIPHVNELLSMEKKKTFKGFHFLFSRVIPLNQDPKTTDLWKDSEAFGATCHSELNEDITHIITDQRLTSKVKQGLKMPGVFIVHVNWLLESRFSYHAKNEYDFFIYSIKLPHPVTKNYNLVRPELVSFEKEIQDLTFAMGSFRKRLEMVKSFCEGDEDAYKNFISDSQSQLSEHKNRDLSIEETNLETIEDGMEDVQDISENDDDLDRALQEAFDEYYTSDEEY